MPASRRNVLVHRRRRRRRRGDRHLSFVRAPLATARRPPKPPMPPPAAPVPVTLAKVEKKDVPVWLEGLGTVAAWQQVTVRAQVDGRLDKVLFTEGQAVKKGDTLAQIDPRPFAAQLHSAEGALARDRAQLHDTQINLERYRELRAQKLIAQQQVDDQAALAGQAEGAVHADEAQIETAQAQPRLRARALAARRHHRRAPGRRRQPRARHRRQRARGDHAARSGGAVRDAARGRAAADHGGDGARRRCRSRPGAATARPSSATARCPSSTTRSTRRRRR